MYGQEQKLSLSNPWFPKGANNWIFLMNANFISYFKENICSVLNWPVTVSNNQSYKVKTSKKQMHLFGATVSLRQYTLTNSKGWVINTFPIDQFNELWTGKKFGDFWIVLFSWNIKKVMFHKKWNYMYCECLYFLIYNFHGIYCKQFNLKTRNESSF